MNPITFGTQPATLTKLAQPQQQPVKFGQAQTIVQFGNNDNEAKAKEALQAVGVDVSSNAEFEVRQFDVTADNPGRIAKAAAKALEYIPKLTSSPDGTYQKVELYQYTSPELLTKDLAVMQQQAEGIGYDVTETDTGFEAEIDMLGLFKGKIAYTQISDTEVAAFMEMNA